jgi:predicted oxidoreductase
MTAQESGATIIVGGGIAGIVAALELSRAGRALVLVDRDAEAAFGGQARESFGGILAVDTPQQRRGNSVPRWHIVWGTGRALTLRLIALLQRERERNPGRVALRFGRRVERLLVEDGRVAGVASMRWAMRCRRRSARTRALSAGGGFQSCGRRISVRVSSRTASASSAGANVASQRPSGVTRKKFVVWSIV